MADRPEDRLRRLFDEIAPPIDAERLASTLAARPVAPVSTLSSRGPLIAVAAALIAFVVLGIGYLLGRGTPNDPAAPTTTAPPPTTVPPPPTTTTTNPTTTTTTLGAVAPTSTLDGALRAVASTLDQIEADLRWLRPAVLEINVAWENRQLTFQQALAGFTRVEATANAMRVQQLEEQFAEQAGVEQDGAASTTPTTAVGGSSPLAAVRAHVNALTLVGNEIVLGINAPDDGSLRRDAVDRFVALIDEALAEIDTARRDFDLPTELVGGALPSTVPDPNPLLSPYDTLTSCGNQDELIEWAEAVFPLWSGAPTIVSPTDTAVWLPLLIDLPADCITAVFSDSYAAWEMRNESGEVIARAAGGFGASAFASPCTPSGAPDQGYWQAQIGSGHWFGGCNDGDLLVASAGRAIDRRWPVFVLEVAPAVTPTETRWPGGWLGGVGYDSNLSQPVWERLLLSRSEEIVAFYELEWLPEAWPNETRPCSRFAATAGNPVVEPGSPRIEVIELCSDQGPEFWYVRSVESLAPADAAIVSVEGIDVRVWETAQGRWAAEPTITDNGYEIPHLRSLQPGIPLDTLFAVLTSTPGFDARYIDPPDGVGDYTEILSQEWLIQLAEGLGWEVTLPPDPCPDCPPGATIEAVDDEVVYGVNVRVPATADEWNFERGPSGDITTYRGVAVYSIDNRSNGYSTARCGGLIVTVAASGSPDAPPVVPEVLFPLLDAIGCTTDG